ncbi:Fimbrillin-A associated anchor protein Mfa1 and Mfa2 [Bacteroides faecichinchillae]|uniref:Fimbrillin-A associated anchor protein Mfa1 and Mfa2 n=4 Tax=Bacteroides faecichinchillae TaxID=871325 RepID=A0A1M4T4K2_9BACE|nr:Fimbrillin-A associated anchor protein Mfa1 and Mfa2 [Bacteroides faecichinchillae]
MRSSKRNIISRLMGAALYVASISFAFSSCERIYDDLAPCPYGVSLRFVYDYNMLYANAFPSSVDCLTLYIYDGNGNYVDTKIVTGTELQDENYRMTLDLEEGSYHFVAYGGLACEEKTFSVLQEPSLGNMYTDLCVGMDIHRISAPIPAERRLHNMFWGELTLTSTELYNEGTVKMMKNTNNIRIVLQQLNGKPVHAEDFEFAITDDNTLFGYDNDLIANGTITYLPWASGEAIAGISGNGENEGEPVIVAYSEFSTSRLMTKNSPKLVIKLKDDGKEIVNIPLNDYLLLLKSELYAKMKPQEFLDRESVWSLVFFLGSDMNWIRTHIKINDWIVRINNAEM